MSIKKKRRKGKLIISSTGIEVTGFNKMDNWILNA
jgi:hypothetical protein